MHQPPSLKYISPLLWQRRITIVICFFCINLKSSIFSNYYAQAFPSPRAMVTAERKVPFYCDCTMLALSGKFVNYSREVSDVESTVILKKKKKKKREKKGAKKLQPGNTGRSSPLSSDDLATHIASQYISGPGAVFGDMVSNREGPSSSSSFYQADPSDENHISHMKMLDRHPSLVLNADYNPLSSLPLSLWSWQETVKAVFLGKVNVVDVYPNITIKAVNIDVPLPSVIALTEYVAQPSHKPAFTRKNVYLRDGYKCQYCETVQRTQDLSLDHVIPRCSGGKLEWENIVTCCRKCNVRKGSIQPSDLRRIGMKLILPPRVPTKFELAAKAGKMMKMPQRVHPSWKPFLGVMGNIEHQNEEEQESMNV